MENYNSFAFTLRYDFYKTLRLDAAIAVSVSLSSYVITRQAIGRQKRQPSRHRALLMATFNNRATLLSVHISLHLSAQSICLCMNDWLTVHYDDDGEDSALHLHLSVPLSLPLPLPVLLHLSLFLPDAETNAPWMDSSTCYIIRNRFYSLVLTISNAYCILLLVLPAISFFSPSSSLCLCLPCALELPAWPTEFTHWASSPVHAARGRSLGSSWLGHLGSSTLMWCD